MNHSCFKAKDCTTPGYCCICAQHDHGTFRKPMSDNNECNCEQSLQLKKDVAELQERITKMLPSAREHYIVNDHKGKQCLHCKGRWQLYSSEQHKEGCIASFPKWLEAKVADELEAVDRG